MLGEIILIKLLLDNLKTCDLEKYYFSLITKVESEDKLIKAFVPEIDRKNRVMNDVKALIEKYRYSKEKPILYGLPVGVKDLFNVEGLPTRAGSLLPSELFRGKEADVVSKLKKAGAIVLGKTVTTEFAYFQPGPTKNPLNPEHTPGGSSSGSAAAVSADFCPLALGTQTIGSVTRPASFCGIYGFKPSYGRISKNGVVPFSNFADHIGFFVRDIDDVKLISSVIVCDWKGDTNRIKKCKIGIPSSNYLNLVESKTLEIFYENLKRLRSHGFEIKQYSLFENIDEIREIHSQINAYEFALVHSEWIKDYRDLYSKHSIDLIEKGLKISNTILKKATESRDIERNRIDKFQEKNLVDFWLSPSTIGIAPKGISSTGNPIMNLPWTFAGVPTLNIPMKTKINNLPYGFQVAAPFNQDERLVSFCETINQYVSK